MLHSDELQTSYKPQALVINDEELAFNHDDVTDPAIIRHVHKKLLLNARKNYALKTQQLFHQIFVDAPVQITHATLQSEYYKSIVKLIERALLNFIDALSVMAVAIGISTVGEAFNINPDMVMTFAMLFTLPQLLLKVAADNNVEGSELFYKIASATYRAFNFFAYVFVLYISTYLAYEQIAHGIGNDTEVEVSNLQYYLQFVLATAVVSVLYAGVLELSKNRLDASEELYAKLGRVLLEVCRSAGVAGNINALAKYALQPFGWKPTGNENEVTRFLGFEAICSFSLLLQLLCMLNKTAGKYLSNTINAVSIVTYGLFLNENKNYFSERELTFITFMFAATGLTAAVLAKFYPGEDINDRPRPGRG